ncbi:MAG TPA: alpha-hydroxy acid oxidase [Bryobacteraceae bacterium]|jgi:4-hydroxymandelate oxidase|nr:alpha-hydroxy acid oxidase [Bryobacteraceae bacterium]
MAELPSELTSLVSLADFELAAEKRTTPAVWARIQGGAADEITLRWNKEAWQDMRLRPRVLVDVSEIDTRVNILGCALRFPILLAPVGAQTWIHPDGDLVAAAGAEEAEALYVISSSASVRVEEISHSCKGPTWFQLYVQRDREFTRDLVQRAEDSGCRALCVTVDSPCHGIRDREQRTKRDLPARELPNFAGPDYLDPTLTWKDIEWLLSFARTPVLLKGILDADDAEAGVERGAAGIVVSNHGGRNLDTSPATAHALASIVDRVAGRGAVVVDGGIRRGTDVLKALALGANAVQIGRPYLHGLAIAGAAGVAQVVRLLHRELELAMMLCGRRTIPSIDRSVLW